MGSKPIPRDIMPLNIGQFLMDTHHLTPIAAYAYLHLQMQYWRYGPLPNEPEALAAIAQLPVDAWSIAQASVKHLFSIGPDGLLHQPETDTLKASLISKHQKAQDKARKAAKARWDKERAKRGEVEANSGDAPSIAQALPKHGPSMASINMGSPLVSLGGFPQTPFLEPSTLLSNGEGSALPEPYLGDRRAQTAAVGQVENGAVPMQSSENKAKTTGEPRRAFAGSIKHLSPRGDRENGVNGVSGRVAQRATNRVRPSEVDREKDGRFWPFREEVFSYWRGQNPERPKCPWGELDARALRGLLEDRPGMQLDEFRELLQKRAASDVNPSDLPRRWLRHIDEFGAGPLNQYRRPARAARTL